MKKMKLSKKLFWVALLMFIAISSLFGYNFINMASPFPSQTTEFHPNLQKQTLPSSPAKAAAKTSSISNPKPETEPYHNWELFASDFEEMKQKLNIFVYPEAFTKQNQFSNIFLPHQNPFLDSKLGNYFSEHMFKKSLLQSPLITSNPEEADFFFLPFSINDLRNDRRVWHEQSIADFVADYTNSISRRFGFWNASGGADHFYVCCHSVGRDAAARHRGLLNNAIQLTCSSSYFQRFYVYRKDAALPQVWPRHYQASLNPPHARHKLAFYAGRAQNCKVRQELANLWGNDTEMEIFNGKTPFPYEEGMKRSKYCLHVKGYEVNTARVSDAIHFGCVPVIISNYYDLPFANVLDWTKFSVIITHGDVPFLKTRLLSITRHKYLGMYQNLLKVRRHFLWHSTPKGYDSFYMTAYQLWLRRSIHRLPSY